MITQVSEKTRPSVFISAVSSALLFISLLLNIFFCPDAHAGETIIAAVTLNTEVKLDVFAILEDDGDFLLRTIDLTEMGILLVDGQRSVIDDEEYVSLRSMPGVDFVFQEASLTLEISADPELLPVAIIDMLPRQKQQVFYPKEDSLFFNYGLNYEGGTVDGDGFKLQSFNISNELGIRKKDILFYTDTIYVDTSNESRFIRLNTNATYDQREEMRRFVIGDYRAFSGELGSRINFAGVSISKNYQIDPYFLETPFFNYSGVLDLPSEVTVYSDEMRLRSQKLAPGRFDLQNFHNTGGAQDIVLEITDSLGRVQRIYTPFYFSDLLLRKGLSEYSYNLGASRRDYGTESNQYSDAVLSARHRYGFSDELNLGYRAEASSDLFNLGFESLYGFNEIGVIGLDISASNDDDGSGWASFFRYEYRNRKFNVRFAWRNLSDEYQTLQRQETVDNRTSDVRFGVGYVERKLGSIALDLARTEFQQRSDENLVLISYSRRLNRKMNLNSNIRYVDSDESRTEVYINLSYYYDNDHTLNTTVRQGSDSNLQSIEARRDVPAGEGWGWRSLLEREDSESEVYTSLSGAQWNAPYGIYRGDINLNSDSESIRLAASGAVVSVGGKYGFTRPVTDSFGLAKVGELEGVRVYTNGQVLGRTDKEGKLFIPELTSFYHNRISIEDEDIPIDYLMPQIEKNISPPFRSGSCVSFPVEVYQAFTGTLTGSIGGEQKNLEYYEGEIFGAMRTIKFFTGSGGEFYFDNDPGTLDEATSGLADEGCAVLAKTSMGTYKPGTYRGQATSDIGEVCQFEIDIIETDERYFDLGEILCTLVAANEIQLEPDTTSEKIEGEGMIQSPDDLSLYPDEVRDTNVTPGSDSQQETVVE